MPAWAKYLISIGAGFGTGALTALSSGAGLKGALIGGAVGAVTSIGNLQTTSPADHAQLGK